jgi:spore coat polysaccharide biosynthesis predicted glycosyltransferase SpsG
VIACDLALAVSGGTGLGLGHLMRAAALAESARERGLAVRVAIDGDQRAAEALRAELPGVELGRWRDAGDLRGARWVAFDTRREIAAELAAVRRAGSRALVLDRLDFLDAADLTVVPALHAPPLAHPRLRMGAPWLVVGSAVRELRAAPAAPPRRALLVSLGGADPLGLTARLAAPLARVAARWPGPAAPPEIHCALGPAFARRAALAAELAALGWRVHDAPPRRALLSLARGALGAVVGFGTSVYDLAFLGVPMVYLTHHAGDRPDAERLAALGIGALAAEGPAFDPPAFERAVAATLPDAGWRARASARGLALAGDGLGTRRILDLLESLEALPLRGAA